LNGRGRNSPGSGIKALSVRQPWAHAIFKLGKDENRPWRTHLRGRILIQAAMKIERGEA